MTSESTIMQQHFIKVSIKFCSSYGSNVYEEKKPNWISFKVKAMPELQQTMFVRVSIH
jgi:hypothetical protein